MEKEIDIQRLTGVVLRLMFLNDDSPYRSYYLQIQ
jgi:hypothetical protein